MNCQILTNADEMSEVMFVDCNYKFKNYRRQKYLNGPGLFVDIWSEQKLLVKLPTPAAIETKYFSILSESE